MFRRWSGSVCSLLLSTCLTACSSSGAVGGSDAGPFAAGSGGSGGQDPDAGTVYEGQAGSSGSNAGQAGSGNSWSPAKDVKPAECLPDPSNFAACGGDVTGKWRLASKCFDAGIDELRDNLMCPAAELKDFSYEYRLLVEFKSSGNYSGADKQDALQKVSVPNSCVPDCSTLGADDADDSDGETRTVTASADACLIEAQLHEAESAAGTWKVEDTTLTMTDSRGPSASQFCISSNTLTLKSVNELSGVITWVVFERL